MSGSLVYRSAGELALAEAPAARAEPHDGAAKKRQGTAPRSGREEGLKLYQEQVRRLAPLSAKETRRLLKRVRHGDERARDEMALRHLGLVVELVEELRPKDPDVLGLLQAGNLALVAAIKTFDPAGKDDFRASVRSYIWRAIERAVRGRPSATAWYAG
jgi:DNA-directed RNA polymerase sigma subunit (sigma70/sigma32)